MQAAKPGLTTLLGQRFSLDQGLLWLGRFALLGVLVGGCWLLLILAWQLALSPPAPPLGVPGPPAEVGRELAARHLFGHQQGAGNAAGDVKGEFRLLGVIAGSGQTSSVALLLRDGDARPLVVVTGGEAAPGIRLLRVEKNRAVLLRDGLEVVLQLPGDTRRSSVSGS